MNLNEWALQWGVPFAAVEDLRRRMGLDGDIPPPPVSAKPRSEAAVQADLRLHAPKLGGRLWRNNVGALQDESGRWMRFGLANDTPAMNKVVKSADLVGIKPHLVSPADVGKTLGLFWSVEAKEEGWRYTGTDHERAQLNWANLITSFGGVATFATSIDNLR